MVKSPISTSCEPTDVRCAIYARYSSDLQRPTSIEDQVRQCRDCAQSNGWTVLDDFVCSDSGISGAWLFGRDGLNSLIEALKRTPRPFDAILIDDTSRFGRNLGDVLRLADIIHHYGVFLVFVSQHLDSRNPSFRQLQIFSGMIDEQYLVGLREKVLRGQKGRVLNKLNPGGKCYGYKNVPIEDPSRRGGYGRPAVIGVRQEIIEAEAEVARRIFSMYADGCGLARIAKQLNKEGVLSPQPPRKGSPRAWCPSGIRETGRKERKCRLPSEHVCVENPDLRIVPQELWERVRRRIQSNNERFGNQRLGGLNRTENSRTYLFSGLLRCGLCGSNMVIPPRAST